METLTVTIIGSGMVGTALVSFIPLWIMTTRDVTRRQRARETARRQIRCYNPLTIP